MRLTKAQILAANDLATEVVSVPEWGGEVTIRMWSGADKDAFEIEQAGGSKVDIRARIAARSIIDDSGQRMFSTADIQAIGAKSGAALDRVVEAVFKGNRYTPAEREQLEGVERSTVTPAGTGG